MLNAQLVNEREDVRAHNLEQVEGLCLVRLLLLDEFIHKLAQLRLTRVGYERLAAENGV